MSTVTINVTVNGCRIVNAQKYAEQFSTAPQWLSGINQLSLECGPLPSYGRFLVRRSDYDDVFPTDEPFAIVFTRKVKNAEGAVTTTTLTATGYYLVSAHSAARMIDSPMIVTVADARHVCRQAVTNRIWNLGTASDKTWANVLADLKADLPTGYASTLAYATSPTGKPYNLIFNGRLSVEALQELASRTRHCLAYDPIAGKLTLANMAGTQTGLAAILAAARVYRTWDPADTTEADEIGVVTTVFHRSSSNYERYEKAIVHPSSASANERLAFGTTLARPGANDTDTDAEAQRLADTWFDWADRKIARVTKQYVGLHAATCGSQVSRVVWLVENDDLHTIIDQGAPPEPGTVIPQHVAIPSPTVYVYTLGQVRSVTLAEMDAATASNPHSLIFKHANFIYAYTAGVAATGVEIRVHRYASLGVPYYQFDARGVTFDVSGNIIGLAAMSGQNTLTVPVADVADNHAYVGWTPGNPFGSAPRAIGFLVTRQPSSNYSGQHRGASDAAASHSNDSVNDAAQTTITLGSAGSYAHGGIPISFATTDFLPVGTTYGFGSGFGQTAPMYRVTLTTEHDSAISGLSSLAALWRYGSSILMPLRALRLAHIGSYLLVLRVMVRWFEENFTITTAGGYEQLTAKSGRGVTMQCIGLSPPMAGSTWQAVTHSFLLSPPMNLVRAAVSANNDRIVAVTEHTLPCTFDVGDRGLYNDGQSFVPVDVLYRADRGAYVQVRFGAFTVEGKLNFGGRIAEAKTKLFSLMSGVATAPEAGVMGSSSGGTLVPGGVGE